MLNTIKTAALSALIGLGTLAAIPASAQAEGIYLNYGNGHSQFGVYTGVRDHGWRERDDRRDDRRFDRKWDRCSPDRALNNAQNMRIRGAGLSDVGRHTVKVSGRKFGERVMVVFANERGCPIMYR